MSARYDCADTQQRDEGLVAAVSAVQEGQLVVLPTDTVYGVGADAFNPKAVTDAARRQGAGQEHAAARARRQRAGGRGADGVARRVRPGPDRRVLAGAADARLPGQPDAHVGPWRHDGHGRGPHAAAPGRPRPAAPHRPDGGVERQPAQPPRRHDGGRGADAARRRDLRLPGRRAVRGQRSFHDPRPDRDGAEDAARGRALRRRPQEGRPGDRPARRVRRRAGAQPGRPAGRGGDRRRERGRCG